MVVVHTRIKKQFVSDHRKHMHPEKKNETKKINEISRFASSWNLQFIIYVTSTSSATVADGSAEVALWPVRVNTNRDDIVFKDLNNKNGEYVFLPFAGGIKYYKRNVFT